MMIAATSLNPVRAQEKPALAPSTASASAKKILSPEDFLELRSVQDPQFSPDGSRVAFVVTDPLKGEKRTQHIWMHDRNTNTARQFTYSEKSESSPRWSPDGKKLAFLSSRGEHQQVYVMNASGGEAAATTKSKIDVKSFAWSPDGTSIAFLSPDAKTDAEEKKVKDKDDSRVVDKDDKHTRLRLFDLATQTERALTEPIWEVEQLEWLPDGPSIVISATNRPASDQNTNRIYGVRVKDGTMTELLAPRGPFGDLRVSPDGLTLGFRGCREDGPVPHDLFLLPIAGGVLRNLTASNLDRPPVAYRWAKGGWLIAVYEDGFRTRFVGYNSQGEKKEASDLPVNPGAFSVAATGEIAFIGETSTSAQELWVRDTKGEARQVSHVNDAWKDKSLIAPEFYKFKSFDGREIEAALLKPAGYDGKSKLPLVALVHGGPTGNWEDRIEAWAQLLAARGYAVFCPNVRGSTGYGQKFIELNRADWGGGDFKDVMWGVDDLVKKGIADPARLGIGGWSYGGYMAEWAVTQTTLFKAAVSGAGMSNLVSEFGTEHSPAYDEWFWGVPYEPDKLAGYLGSSPFVHLKNARTPTLILQGEVDATDPLGQSQELYRGLKHYGVETELVVYPREPHGFQEAKHRVDMQRRMLEWFDKYLKASR